MIEVHLNSETQTGLEKAIVQPIIYIVLDFLTKYALNNKKKIFCAFKDFRQAFDTVWGQGLWTKVIKVELTGTVLDLLRIFKRALNLRYT